LHGQKSKTAPSRQQRRPHWGDIARHHLLRSGHRIFAPKVNQPHYFGGAAFHIPSVRHSIGGAAANDAWILPTEKNSPSNKHPDASSVVGSQVVPEAQTITVPPARTVVPGEKLTAPNQQLGEKSSFDYACIDCEKASNAIGKRIATNLGDIRFFLLQKGAGNLMTIA
jgi:hypothetical protein